MRLARWVTEAMGNGEGPVTLARRASIWVRNRVKPSAMARERLARRENSPRLLMLAKAAPKAGVTAESSVSQRLTASRSLTAWGSHCVSDGRAK